MTDHPTRLFVYGTLAPGRDNEHMLAHLPGAWQPAWARGRLHPEGWGAALGYPAIELDASADPVEGFLFSCPDLAAYWQALDDFEGEGYQRVITQVTLAEGSVVDAQIYALTL